MRCRRHKGMALIIAMIFVVVFSALAIAMSSMSSSNVQMASNHHEANVAFANAESGLEAIKYWLSRISMPGATSASNYLATVLAYQQTNLVINNISNIILNNDGSISPVALDSSAGHTFSAQMQIHPGNPNVLQVSVTGNCGQIARTIQVSFNIEPTPFPVFDYGIATKGPVLFDGNPTIEGVNYDNEADIYIESQNSVIALQVNGNANFDGNINIGNEDGNACFDGDVSIGGDSGQAAIDNHVFTSSDPVEFPVPNTEHFRQYATGSTVDSGTNTDDSMILSNVVIASGTNPCFSGNIEIRGVLYIEAPNQVQFDGNVDVKGLIIADGDVEDPGSNSMIFKGNFESGTFPAGGEYDAIRSETGSSLIAPGFGVELAGNFASLGGVMAVSGFHLSGNANAVVNGSIVNYSDSQTVIDGNATLRFDRSDSTQTPAGFDANLTLEYDASSYSTL